MKRFYIILLCLINVLTYTFSQKSDHKNGNISKSYFIINPELRKKLDAAGQQFVDAGQLSGGVSMIMHQDKIIYQKAFGMQSIEDHQTMHMNSLFRIASMTKPMMTVALLMLVEEGKIKLEDKAEKWLPQFATIKVLEEDGSLVAPRTPVTIKHLLMHTSGTRSRADAWFRKNNIDPNKAASLKEYVDFLLQAPLINHPGEGFNYAMNNDMVARIIEIITKKNFGDFMQERLFKPLGMNSTWWIVPEKELHRMASIYLLKDNKLILVESKEPVQSAFPRGNGQLVASAEDYIKFIQLLLNDGVYKEKRLIKKELLDIMITDMLPSSIPLKVGNTVFPNTGFGLSVAINSGANKEKWSPQPVLFENLFQHLPHGSYLWPGVTNTYWWVDPKNKVGGLVLSQLANPGIIGNFQEFTQTFYNGFYNTSEAEQLKPVKDAATKSIWDQEIEFSNACAEIGIYNATTKYLADNGILFKPGPVNGKKYQSEHKPAPVFIKTYPESVEAALGGDMGFVTGYWELEDTKPKSPPTSFGFFSTVWSKQGDGDWKVICATATGGIKPAIFSNYIISPKWNQNNDLVINKNCNSEDLIKIDNQLNQSILQGDSKISAYFTNSCQILRNGKLPINNADEMLQQLTEININNWENLQTNIASLGDMAYTYGSFNYIDVKNQSKEGYYFRFWKRDAQNNWKVFMDMINE